LAYAPAVEITIHIEARTEVVRDQRAACIEYRADRRLRRGIGIRHQFERIVRHRGDCGTRGLTGRERRGDVGVGCKAVLQDKYSFEPSLEVCRQAGDVDEIHDASQPDWVVPVVKWVADGCAKRVQA